MGNGWLGRILATALAAAALAACGRPGEESVAGDSLLPRFAAGTFLPDAWLALPEIDRLRATRARYFAPARLLALESGWSKPEPWGVFGLGKRSELVLHLSEAGPRDLVIDCGLPEVPNPPPQTVEVTINGTPVDHFEVPDPGWRRIRLSVPAGLLRAGANQVSLGYAGFLRPDGPDRRPLALGVRRIGLVRPGYEPPGDPGGEAPLPYKVDEARDAVYLIEPGRFLVPYDVPAGGARWRFALSTRNWQDAGERLRVTALTLDGEEHPLARFDQDGAAELDLTSLAGRRTTLVFTTHPPEGAQVEIRRPHTARTTAELAGPVPGARPARSEPTRTPHVLLIILDALRADHVGAYGYQRDTTPRIDRLAQEGVALENVIAECPYTSCSSPAILSGVPFAEHGVVDVGQRIGEGVETLASRLAAAGYRTVGFSGNPNNSQATGGNRGFDEYYESWRIYRRAAEDRERWHPEALTDLVIGRLEQGFGDQPSLVMVHYVPPHEPYAPDPEHDVFSDPEYKGPITGDKRQARAVFKGQMSLDAADHAKFVALYDGNLLQADHHLGRLLDAYRDAGIWDDTLVIVTSDHGEAFAEHDAIYGHNETLFRAMLDVPLVIRLPSGMEKADGPRDRFASLTSVTPTILARLGLVPDRAVVGVDLLGPSLPDDAERLVVLRSGHADIPVWGVQTARFKAIVRSRRVAQLFDWRADPLESSNLASRHPVLWTGLILRIEETISRSQGSAPSALSEEDKKMLESLGYTG